MTIAAYASPLLDEWFWTRIAVNENGCWIWNGTRNHAGYGLIRHWPLVGTSPAHRVMYSYFVGPIPDGLALDHLCFNKPCCNPAHLEPVTHAENNRRYVAAGRGQVAKTHCPKGHPYSDENTWLNKYGHRFCRECNRINARKYKHRSAA